MLSSVFKENNTWLPGDAVGNAQVATYIDFRSIKSVSTAAALVLAAEYDRARQLGGAPAPVFDLDEWDPEVFETLWQLGFFETVGLTLGDEEKAVVNEDVMTLRFVSGSDAA
ncbi:hypothetical protein, partial [Devosia sp.]|uniref:hypothetical protein n=1 Tax=Devosia sp. TaxID=1871048 RepID=UPI002623B8FA